MDSAEGAGAMAGATALGGEVMEWVEEGGRSEAAAAAAAALDRRLGRCTPGYKMWSTYKSCRPTRWSTR